VSPTLAEQISDFVHGQAETQLNFVIDLCNQNSHTYHADGTNQVAEMVLSQVKGFFRQHEIVEQAEVGNHHILRTAAAQTSPSLKSIYLLGHMDTVFPPDHPFQKCQRDGDWLIGPGTGDMKGGLAVIVYALKALEYFSLIEGLRLTLILSGDEEIGSATSHSLYQEETRKANACLVAECAGSEGQVVISRNGKAGARLDCFGQDRHVSMVKGEKASAIVEMAHKILALEALNESYPGVTINVGRVEGGLGPSTVPAQSSCLFDMRWEEEKYHHPVLDDVRRIIQESTQRQCRGELKILNYRPAMPANPKIVKMFQMLRRIAGSAGMSITAEHRKGTSDANFFGAAGVPTLDGFGPICADDHTPSERILISSMVQRTRLLALFLSHLGSDHPL
jgi:glutamate carboxypeptidase